MKVRQAMTRDVQIANPDDRIQDIARRMAEADIGFMPVGDKERLVGTITDRDIVVRCVAEGKDGDARVRDAMTKDVKYCFDDEDMDHVVSNMGDIQVRRLPVVSRDKRLVGVVTLADAALAHDPEGVGVAMTGVVDPGGQHNQSQSRHS
jgi:CBS domain-containing protein